jgi:hypothetical protein
VPLAWRFIYYFFLIKLFSDYSFTFLKVEKWIHTIIGIWFLRVIKLNFKLRQKKKLNFKYICLMNGERKYCWTISLQWWIWFIFWWNFFISNFLNRKIIFTFLCWFGLENHFFTQTNLRYFIHNNISNTIKNKIIYIIFSGFTKIKSIVYKHHASVSWKNIFIVLSVDLIFFFVVILTIQFLEEKLSDMKFQTLNLSILVDQSRLIT